MKCAREPYSQELVSEMIPLWSAHDAEVPQLGLKLDPDLETYSKMDKSGALRIYTARIMDRLMGYQVFFLTNHPHRRTSLEAAMDLLYLDPQARKGMTGVRFIRWVDEALMAEGVKVIFRTINAENRIKEILMRMHYTMTDVVYGRTL